MTRDEIQKEFDRFFEFDTDNRSIVTSTSAKLFAEHIAGLTVAAEREACARAASIALLGADKSLSDRVVNAIRSRGQRE